MVLKVEHITKKIKSNTVLDNISLTFESGKIYGIVGRNGAGKTMLFRAMAGIMNIDSGTVQLDNQTLHQDFNVLPSLGIVLENSGLYPELTGFENLMNLANLKKIATKEDIRNAISRVGLNPDDKRTYKKYSLGMKKRIVLAQAIMEKPDILFLDEPTSALDEEGVQEIRKLILEEKQRGAMIIIASHNSEDIELLTDEIYRIADGRMVNDK